MKRLLLIVKKGKKKEMAPVKSKKVLRPRASLGLSLSQRGGGEEKKKKKTKLQVWQRLSSRAAAEHPRRNATQFRFKGLMGVVGVIRVTSLSLSWTLAFGWWSEYSKWGGGGFVIILDYFAGDFLAYRDS
ncbi:hypothetical protein ACN38_g2794 [Penicillium nordicum]|uniref:Uncharacterized protein n=1 Tax=Penicillium nordicum TaxID=229535 RepID=A0A0M9WIL8_9EURO|nr:hypothetical protein ACN38_g2794 [Penicillium nordicum]